jgi:hypothetical protein
MFNVRRISLKLTVVKIGTVLNYTLCREGVWRSVSVASRTLNLDTEVGIVAVLWAGRSVVRISAEALDFSLLRIVQTGPGVHPASCSVGT